MFVNGYQHQLPLRKILEYGKLNENLILSIILIALDLIGPRLKLSLSFESFFAKEVRIGSEFNFQIFFESISLISERKRERKRRREKERGR